MRSPCIIVAALSLAACSSGGTVASDAPPAAIIDTATMAAEPSDASGSYRIGASDELSISVFQVPDLSFAEIFVDASGNLQLPLLGSIRAAGLTPRELSDEIQRQLGARYLRNPQVAVTVKKAASQKITVDGAVTTPGVFEMRGRTTLMQAVAMAQGATRTADIRRVAVFRTVDDRRMVAVFDLAAIRSGAAVDPVLQGDDSVVVDTSRLNAAVRQVVEALPGLAVFGYL